MPAPKPKNKAARRNLKAYFSASDSTDTGLEILKMFILPFMRVWNPRASVDDAMMAFFGTEERTFFHGTAKRSFNMIGLLCHPPHKPHENYATTKVHKGDYLLIAADKAEQTARVDFEPAGGAGVMTFKLTRAQLDFLKDHIDVVPA